MINQFINSIQERMTSIHRKRRIGLYKRNNRKPWTVGYSEYREWAITQSLNNENLIRCFLFNAKLPETYGYRLDERIIELPWVLARLASGDGYLLDAGSALNFPYLLNLPVLRTRDVVMYTLSPESILSRKSISYIYGDLRQTILKNECFDEIVCISTLEHVGMDNTALYSTDERFAEFRPKDYQLVIKEFYRLMKSGGKLYITVPYGRHHNHGWLQIFDKSMVVDILDVFSGSSSSIVYYLYAPDGWQISSADECAESTYFDIHQQADYDTDYAAAARAVACLELTK